MSKPMNYFKSVDLSNERRGGRYAAASLCLAVICATAGCNGLPGNSETASETPSATPQQYMASIVGATTGVTSALQSYTFDNKANTFQQVTNELSRGSQSQINNAGTIAALARNLLALDTTYSFPFGTSGTGTTYNPAKAGSFAIQLPDQTGGLVDILNQPFTPLVASVCPASTKAQTFQFLTIPSPLLTPAAGTPPTAFLTFNPALETAYGSVDISGSGSTVSFANTKQMTFPSATAPATTPSMSFSATADGVCSATLYGNTIEVPGQTVISNPGSGESLAPAATIGVSTSGLLVESNGATSSSAYQNALGAGTGAIGLLKPASALDTGALVAAQYTGFFYGSGNASAPTNFSSSVASFGFASVPASCASVTAPTSTLIYGGDFANNDPSAASVQTAGGFGNCDYAIDLGTQDGANHGFYPAATMWVGAGFARNITGKAYSFPAIAIAGQLAGKYAIFLLGVDMTGSPNQAEGIYLLQSN